MALTSRSETLKVHSRPQRAVCCLSYVLRCSVHWNRLEEGGEFLGRFVTVVKTDCRQTKWLTDQPVPPNTVQLDRRHILSALQKMVLPVVETEVWWFVSSGSGGVWSYINIQWCIGQTRHNFMFVSVLGQHVSILIESSSGLSKIQILT